jgi:undecaprenyl-diphosphatase
VKPLWLIVALVLLLVVLRVRSLGRGSRVLLFLAAVAAGIVGSGVIHFPAIETIVGDIGDSLGAWAYPLVGICAFLETGAFLGFIAPGETMVLFGGVLAGGGTIELIPLIAVVWVSCMLGDLCSYLIGRRYGRGFLLKWGARVKVGEPQIRFVEGFFERHGFLSIFLGRWIGVIRPLIPFLAGSSRISFVRFAAIDVVATFLWSTALSVLGSIFWQNFDEVVSLVSRFLFILASVVIVGGALAFAVSARRSERRSAAIESWLDEQRVEHPVAVRPASWLWGAVTHVEPHLPGRRARRQAPGEGDTVPDDRSASTETAAADRPAE